MLTTLRANMCKATVCMSLLLAAAHADSIQLRDGRHLQGKYLGGTTTAVEFMTSTSVEYFPVSNVLVLVFDNTGIVYQPTGDSSGFTRFRPLPKKTKSHKTQRACCRV